MRLLPDDRQHGWAPYTWLFYFCFFLINPIFNHAGWKEWVATGLGTVAFLTDPASPWWQYANLLGYNSSKAALNAVTLIYANSLRDAGIKVNALAPGFVATDLNRHTGTDTVEQGGARIASQVLLPDDGPTGVFLHENGGTYPW